MIISGLFNEWIEGLLSVEVVISSCGIDVV